MSKSQQKSKQNPAHATLFSLLSTLTKDRKRLSEEHTDVSSETRRRVIENLQKLRQAIANSEATYRFPYLSPIELSTLEQTRSDALLCAQAFHLEYDQLAVLPRLHQQRDLYNCLTACLEAGRRAREAIGGGTQ